jgi:hypothetical protein
MDWVNCRWGFRLNHLIRLLDGSSCEKELVVVVVLVHDNRLHTNSA